MILRLMNIDGTILLDEWDLSTYVLNDKSEQESLMDEILEAIELEKDEHD